MPLTTCPDCGREISSLAPACVHCGRPAQGQGPPQQTAYTAPGCPLCGTTVTHPNARTGGAVWCERCGGQLIYGTDGTLVRALPRTQAVPQQQQPRVLAPVVVVGNQKSVGIAVLLAIFFGPLGMLYSTVSGAFIMFFVSFFVALFTLGLGIFLTWPICVIWAAYAAGEHNRRLALDVRVMG